jgi:hypothetical protein
MDRRRAGGAIVSEMTLEEVSREIKKLRANFERDTEPYLFVSRMADSIDANIAQHAEMVAKLRELQMEWSDWRNDASTQNCGLKLRALLDEQPAAMTGESHDL